VHSWGRAEVKRQKAPETQKYLRSLVENLIPLIRFPLMDPWDFRARVLPADSILHNDEVTAVLVEFSVPLEDRYGAYLTQAYFPH